MDDNDIDNDALPKKEYMSKESERRRRMRLNLLFGKLKESLPTFESPEIAKRLTKESILSRAVDYIILLQNRNSELHQYVVKLDNLLKENHSKNNNNNDNDNNNREVETNQQVPDKKDQNSVMVDDPLKKKRSLEYETSKSFFFIFLLIYILKV
jgi:hypothetical protein